MEHVFVEDFGCQVYSKLSCWSLAKHLHYQCKNQVNKKGRVIFTHLQQVVHSSTGHRIFIDVKLCASASPNTEKRHHESLILASQNFDNILSL